MSAKLAGWDDTIVALATPPGIGALAVVRLSGLRALDIIDRLFPAKKISGQASHTLHVGLLKSEGEILDEVVVSLFKAPRSYTGEDVIEISGHGSPWVQEQIIRACIRQGARLARPGEFTQRAFLNGKLDLAQAEAVADLIASQAETARRTALHNLRGGFSRDLQDLREKLLRFSALIELELDFSQEDLEFADRKQFYALIDEALDKTNHLLHSFALGNVVRQGVQVAIVGRPNAGKSTLLNALLNENRAIVSEMAGTTRDTIEELVNIEGIVFRLVDTAGIRNRSNDPIEQLGMEKSREKMAQADIVLVLIDPTEEIPEQERWSLVDEWMQQADARGRFLFVVNKTDLVTTEAARYRLSRLLAAMDQRPLTVDESRDLIFISARTGEGLAALKQTLVRHIWSGKLEQEGTVVTNARHMEALQQVADSLEDIRKGLDQSIPGDLLSADIRRCLHALGEITGEVTTEDQLDYIFSKFCIGK